MANKPSSPTTVVEIRVMQEVQDRLIAIDGIAQCLERMAEAGGTDEGLLYMAGQLRQEHDAAWTALGNRLDPPHPDTAAGGLTASPSATLFELRQDVAQIVADNDVHTLPGGDAGIFEAGRRIPVIRRRIKELHKKYEHLIQGDIETNEVTDNGVMPLEDRLEDVLKSTPPDSPVAALVTLTIAYYLDTQLNDDVIARILELIEREGGPPIDVDGLH